MCFKMNIFRSHNSQHWDFGEYQDGLLLCGREENLEKGEDSGFLSLMLTIAKSRNVYTKWGTTNKHQKAQKVNSKNEFLQRKDEFMYLIAEKFENRRSSSFGETYRGSGHEDADAGHYCAFECLGQLHQFHGTFPEFQERSQPSLREHFGAHFRAAFDRNHQLEE